MNHGCHLLVYRTIVIDAGKNFQAAALEWFPKYGLRRIDALLITHAHADGVCSVSHKQRMTYILSSYERIR
jgi:phosphoribosyl 1,2-cyclic phosphodiesterase